MPRKSWPVIIVALLVGVVVGYVLPAARPPGSRPVQPPAVQPFARPSASLEFRAIVARPSDPLGRLARRKWDDPFWDRAFWETTLSAWAGEGYTAVIWFVYSAEFGLGNQQLVRFEAIPEARELDRSQNEAIIGQFRWLLQGARSRGMRNYLYLNTIHYTRAFARSKGLGRPLPVSPTVSISQQHDPEGGSWNNAGVRNEATRRYTEMLIAEVARTYPELDGFYGGPVEAVPGRRSTWFKEAIVPGLRGSGRNVHMIATQWQVPIDEYKKDIAPPSIYDNTWLSIHAYNAEQITDTKPYPFVTHWAEDVGIPAVVVIYPANVYNFPFNSPKMAFEIATELKKIMNVRGFVYFGWAGRPFEPLFREALAYYARSHESYSVDPWIARLEQKFGSRQAARHLLNAYDLSARIIPETSALVWTGHDITRRELRIPYLFFTGDWLPYSLNTSRVRGAPLIPVWIYARWAARAPDRFLERNGSKPLPPEYRQLTTWNMDGGGVYDVIPSVHMSEVRRLGEQSFQEAAAAVKLVKRNREEARRIAHWMNAYRLLARYYERKVAAASAALIYTNNRKAEDRLAAEKLADEALNAHLQAATFMHTTLDPIAVELFGEPIKDLGIASGPDLPRLMEDERQDRRNMASIFGWK